MTSLIEIYRRIEKEWIGPEGQTKETYKASEAQIIDDFRTQVKRYCFYNNNQQYVCKQIRNNKTKADAMVMRCANHDTQGCSSTLRISTDGILRWFAREPFIKGDVKPTEHTGRCIVNLKKLFKGDKVKVKDTSDISPIRKAPAQVFDKKEVTNYVNAHQDKTTGEVSGALSHLVTERLVTEEKLKGMIRGARKKNLDDDPRIGLVRICPIISFSENESSKFCRLESNFVDYSDSVQRMVIFSTTEQTAVLLLRPILLFDGWFKLSVKGFTQMVTISAFVRSKQMHLPIAHILLSNSKEETYSQAIRAFKDLADVDNNNCNPWDEIIMLSDYEKALRNGIKQIFPYKYFNGLFLPLFKGSSI